MIRLPDRVQIATPAPSADNPLGNPDAGGANWETAAVEPASVQNMVGIARSSESTVGEDVVISRLRLILCPVTACTAYSLVRWRGTVYAVDGEVQPVTDDRGRVSHHVAVLKLVSG